MQGVFFLKEKTPCTQLNTARVLEKRSRWGRTSSHVISSHFGMNVRLGENSSLVVTENNCFPYPRASTGFALMLEKSWFGLRTPGRGHSTKRQKSYANDFVYSSNDTVASIEPHSEAVHWAETAMTAPSRSSVRL
jgi:hypothetical protein